MTIGGVNALVAISVLGDRCDSSSDGGYMDETGKDAGYSGVLVRERALFCRRSCLAWRRGVCSAGDQAVGARRSLIPCTYTAAGRGSGPGDSHKRVSSARPGSGGPRAPDALFSLGLHCVLPGHRARDLGDPLLVVSDRAPGIVKPSRRPPWSRPSNAATAWRPWRCVSRPPAPACGAA
jgi:hypothetical protein